MPTVNDGNMEEGSLRCDANVSVRPQGRDETRHENRSEKHQFVRYLEKALEFESRGNSVVEAAAQLCRDPALGRTRTRAFSMRTKEDGMIIAYFP